MLLTWLPLVQSQTIATAEHKNTRPYFRKYMVCGYQFTKVFGSLAFINSGYF